MRYLSLTNPCGYLLGLDRCDLCWANKKTVQEIKGKVFKSLSLLFRIWIDIMGGVVSIQSGNIRQFHYIFVEDSHLAQRFDPDAKRLRGLLTCQAWVMIVDVFGGDIQRLSVHGSSCFVPSHLAALVRLFEETRDPFWNMRAEFGRHSSDADWTARQTVVTPVFDVAFVLFHFTFVRTRSDPLVDRKTSASSAGTYNFVLINVVFPDRRLTVDFMDNVSCAAPNTVSHKKSHCTHPQKPSRKLSNGRYYAQGVAE